MAAGPLVPRAAKATESHLFSRLFHPVRKGEEGEGVALRGAKAFVRREATKSSLGGRVSSLAAAPI